MNQFNCIKILGINFFNGTVEQVMNFLKSGGLLVVPAAPALITIKSDASYYQSLLSADVVIPDSGYMSLVWNLFHKKKIKRISGLEFLTAFFEDTDVKTAGIVLINPDEKEAETNLSFLRQKEFDQLYITSYTAPMYEKKRVEDKKLLEII